LGEVLRRLAEQKECRIEEGHLLADHVHMMISIPPKCSVSSVVVSFIKGKSAIHLARVYGEQKQNYAGQSFWARGYLQFGSDFGEGNVAEFIDDDQLHAGPAGQLAVE
jgi:putative transposase